MTGTSLVVVKLALLAALEAALSATDVQVAYEWPGGREERECAYLGDAEFQQAPVTFSGGGRTRRSEDVTAEVHVSVTKVGATKQETEARAVEIGTLFEHAIAANPTLGGAALKFTVSGGAMGSAAEDEFTRTVLSYEVSAESHLT